MAEAFDGVVERGAVEMEGKHDLAFVALHDIGVEAAKQAGHAFGCFAETDAVAGRQTLARFRQRAPEVRALALDQRRLDARNILAAHADAVETRGNDARVVDDENVAGAQEIREVANKPVFEIGTAALQSGRVGMPV